MSLLGYDPEKKRVESLTQIPRANARTKQEQERQEQGGRDYYGLSPYSPADIFEQANKGPSRHGAVGELVQGGSAVIGAGIETLVEGTQQAGDLLGMLGATEDQFIDKSDEPQTEFDVVKWAIGDHSQDPTEGTGKASPEVERAQNLAHEWKQAVESKDALDRTNLANLTEKQQQGFEDAQALAQERIDNIEQAMFEHAELNASQDILWNAQERLLFGDKGLLPGASDEERERINEALDLATGEAPGLQREVLEAIDIVLSSNLTGDEMMDRLDFITDQAGIKNLVTGAIGDLASNKRDLEEFLTMTPVEWVEAAGNEADFFDDTYRWDLQVDANARTDAAMTQALEEYIETQVGVVPGTAVSDLNNLVDQLIDTPGFVTSPAFSTLLANLEAQVPGVTAAGLTSAVEAGLTEAAAVNQAWDEAFTYKSYEPGSKALGIVLYQTTLGADIDALNAMNPTERAILASMMAESKAMHAVIQAKSQGKVGWNNAPGTQRGIGGLSESWYLSRGFDPENLSTEDEFEALIEYVLEKGGPTQAFNDWIAHGEWGE